MCIREHMIEQVVEKWEIRIMQLFCKSRVGGIKAGIGAVDMYACVEVQQ